MLFSCRYYINYARNIQILILESFFFSLKQIFWILADISNFDLEFFYLKLKTVVLQTTSSVKQPNTAFPSCGCVMRTQIVQMGQMKQTVVSMPGVLNLLLWLDIFLAKGNNHPSFYILFQCLIIPVWNLSGSSSSYWMAIFVWVVHKILIAPLIYWQELQKRL